MVKDKFENSCTIIDSKAALFLIHDTSTLVEQQIKEIALTIEELHNLNSNLLSYTQLSNEYMNNKICK